MTTCKNCNNQFEGKYCNNCGQSANIQPITFHFLGHELQHGLLHFDQGIFYTIKELIIRPGHTIREYLDGNRVKHLRPFSFLLLIAGIYGFLYHYFDINIVSSLANESSQSVAIKTNTWISSHFSILQFICLPLFSIATWIVFKNKNRNLAEFFIFNTYITGQRIIAQLFLLPLMILFNGTHTLKLIVSSSVVIYVILYCWGVLQFFQYKGKLKIFFKSILALILFYVMFIILYIIVILLLSAFNII